MKKQVLLIICSILMAAFLTGFPSFEVEAAPAAPQITLKPNGTGKIEITWKKVKTATNYKVKRKAPGETDYSDIKTKLTDTKWTDSGLVSGKVYSYKVYAYDASGNSSPVVSGKSMMTITKDPVKDIKATKSKDNPCYNIQITWKEVPGATSYRIYRRKDGVSEYGSPYATGVKVTSYLDTNKGSNLLAGTGYCYRVYAEYNGVECSPKPAGIWEHTALHPPTVSIDNKDVTSTSVRITWGPATGATSFRVDRAQGTQWKTVKSGISTSQNSYIDTGLVPNTKYRYRVYAVNKYGKSKAQEGTRVTTKKQKGYVSDGEYTIYTALRSGVAMSVVGANKASGTNIHIYDNKGSTGQFFTVKNRGEGWYTIEFKSAGTVLDVKGQSKNSGANVLLNTYVSGRESQLWTFEETGGAYYIKNKLGCYLTVQGGKDKNKTNVDVENKVKSKAQKWYLYSTNNLGSACINLSKTTYTYTGEHFTPKAEVKVANKYLKEGTDYELAYMDDWKVGSAHVTVKGKGKYTSAVIKTFTIKQAKDSISANNISLNASYDRKQTKTFSASAKSGKDLTYKSNNTNVSVKSGTVTVAKNWAGTAKITISTDGKGNYSQAKKTIKVTVNKIKNTVKASDVKKDSATSKKEYSLNASCLGGASLSYESSDSKLTVKKGKVVVPANWSGKATITITAKEKGIFKSASKKVTVTINKVENNGTIKYGEYNQLDYSKLTSNKKRITALNKAKQMTNVIWRCPVDFITWSSSGGTYNSVTSTSGRKTYQFKKGEYYQGIPYSMIDHNYDDKKWTKLLQGKITATMMSKTFRKYPKPGTARGVDCSKFVNIAFKETGYNVPYQDTANMLKSKYYKKITYSELKPGDILLKNGHVMMFAGKTGSKYAVYEATAEGSKCRYFEYSYSKIKKYGAYKFIGYGD